MNRGQRTEEGRWLRWLEMGCAVASLLAFLSWFAARAMMMHAARVAEVQMNLVPAQPPTQSGAPFEAQVTGQVFIPALHLRAPVTEGVGKIELIEGVGRIQGSAIPGGLGTMALAGHRDSFFRSLEYISRGMEVDVSDHTGTYVYLVDGTRIVQPEQVDILDIVQEPSLVLITCYPFRYIGAAPQRFIVHAHLTSLLPVSRK